MKTGSHRTYWGPGRVSISRYARGANEGFRTYSALAPGAWFRSVSREEYVRRFTAQLDALDARQVWAELHELAGGAEPVLLCWEVPPFTEKNWCHRRMVADWLKRELGVDVPELTKDELKGQGPKPTRPTSPKPTSSGQLGLDFSGGAPKSSGPLQVLDAKGEVRTLGVGESVDVLGSKGDKYTLTNRDGELHCTCLGFRYSGARHTCRHAREHLVQTTAQAA